MEIHERERFTKGVWSALLNAEKIVRSGMKFEENVYRLKENHFERVTSIENNEAIGNYRKHTSKNTLVRKDKIK